MWLCLCRRKDHGSKILGWQEKGVGCGLMATHPPVWALAARREGSLSLSQSSVCTLHPGTGKAVPRRSRLSATAEPVNPRPLLPCGAVTNPRRSCALLQSLAAGRWLILSARRGTHEVLKLCDGGGTVNAYRVGRVTKERLRGVTCWCIQAEITQARFALVLQL